MTNNENHNENQTQEYGRGEFLKKGLLWGGAGTAAFALGTAGDAVASEARASGKKKGKRVVFDVACLGDTFRILFAPGAPESGDLRGSTFSVEGSIYPKGTIEGNGFDPESAEAIGRWMCRGWFLINPDRPEPHVLTTQEYILGDIRTDRLYPPNQLVSSGMEGSDNESQTPVRSVIGGTGKYLGAKGVVLQYGRGTNTTTLATLELPAPNFQFKFRLV